MLNLLKPPIEAFQEFVLLSIRAVRNIFRSPHYADDIFIQMDVIGVGSLFIVSLIGLFSGIVMALQMARALTQYGAQGQVGQIVSVTLVRELGPVLTAVLVAGRNASGIASELGSMKVTEQIDAMRALGTDPIQKLVTPRLIALATVLPLLTIISDFIGLAGGYFIASTHVGPDVFRILDLGLAGSGIQRYSPGVAQALGFRRDHRPGGMLLRHAHHRRHPRRGPVHHQRRGQFLRLDFRADGVHHLRLEPSFRRISGAIK